jgi:putative flippase GtrA
MRAAAQFVLFLLVGIVNTALHFCTFVLLFRIFGVPLLVASASGYAVGLLNSYVLNRRFTFRVQGRARRSEFLRFLAVNVLSLGVNLAVLALLTRGMGMSPELAQGVAIAFSLATNFTGNRCWVFTGDTRARKR